MKYKNVKLVTMGLAVALSLTGGGSQVLAWGPERPTYTNQNPADHATFNSITDNAAVGDERDFVRIVEKHTGGTYSSEIEVEADKQYEVYIYYHNDASETYNDAAHNYVGIARDVRMSSAFPHSLSAGERGTVSGKITSSNAEPRAVWDEAYITAKENMTLHYVIGSAKIYNQWGTNGKTLSTNLFSADGTFIGFDELNGVLLGCDRFSGQVVYTIQTMKDGEADDPDDPVPPDPEDPDPEDPETPGDTPVVDLPDELPTTGPIEIALAVVVIIALVSGVVYWRRSSKAVKKATKNARGRKTKK